MHNKAPSSLRSVVTTQIGLPLASLVVVSRYPTGFAQIIGDDFIKKLRSSQTSLTWLGRPDYKL